MMHRFDPKNLARLDSPERRALLPPEKTLHTIGLKEGETLLDIGAGIGYFSIPALDIVGPAGSVIAADLSSEMLAELTLRAGKRPNLMILRSAEDRLPVADGTAGGRAARRDRFAPAPRRRPLHPHRRRDAQRRPLLYGSDGAPMMSRLDNKKRPKSESLKTPIKTTPLSVWSR